jgi:hypothetical protein
LHRRHDFAGGYEYFSISIDALQKRAHSLAKLWSCFEDEKEAQQFMCAGIACSPAIAMQQLSQIAELKSCRCAERRSRNCI